MNRDPTTDALDQAPTTGALTWHVVAEWLDSEAAFRRAHDYPDAAVSALESCAQQARRHSHHAAHADPTKERIA